MTKKRKGKEIIQGVKKTLNNIFLHRGKLNPTVLLPWSSTTHDGSIRRGWKRGVTKMQPCLQRCYLRPATDERS